MRLSTALAHWLAVEQVSVVFALMGDGNLHFVGELELAGQVEIVHGRHENALLTMAHGYAVMNRDVGVCTVTCGPGLAQVTTALTAAVRAHVPVVLIAGETPLRASFHYQHFEAEGMISSTGAGHIRILSPERAAAQVQEAFFRARSERRPVVITVPADVQRLPVADAYEPSRARLVPVQVPCPDPDVVAQVAAVLVSAQRPCILAGRGAVAAQAEPALAALVARTGAVAATTLPAQGFFDDLDPDLVVGVAGGFASSAARSILRSADCVVAFGASLGRYTTEDGQLFADARIVQVDTEPAGLHEGRYVADCYLRSDARLAAEAIEAHLAARGHVRKRWCASARTERDELLGNAGPVPYLTSPAAFVDALREGIPRDARVVVGGGHFWSFVLPDFRVVAPEDLFITADFGAIAQAVPFAIGGGRCADLRPLFVVEGDGGLMMHIQELETAVRLDSPCCIVVMNDGGYGAEKHMLSAHGLDGAIADFGYVNIAGVARAFGARAEIVTEAEQLHKLVAAYRRSDGLMVIDVRYGSGWISPSYQRLFFSGADH